MGPEHRSRGHHTETLLRYSNLPFFGPLSAILGQIHRRAALEIASIIQFDVQLQFIAALDADGVRAAAKHGSPRRRQHER